MPLAPVREPTLVASAVAQALDVRDTGRYSIVDVIAAQVGETTGLLVLDNFEHVVEEASLVTDLLLRCPSLSCLVTSRVLLQVSGEHAFPLPPLPLPPRTTDVTAEYVARSPAVQLFVNRARAARPDFALTDANAATVEEICRRLDGVPLAIELAAARVRHLTPIELAARIGGAPRGALGVLTGGPRDAPSRQRSMRDAIGWSYDLLSEAEQTILRQSAVFVGGFTREAAIAVVRGASLVEDDIDERIIALIDHSLLLTEIAADGSTRYTMLETVREYGLERLIAQGEAHDARQRHAAFALELAEQAARHLEGPAQAQWLDRLEEERSNISAALIWLRRHQEFEAALRLAAAVWRFWMDRCHYREGRMQLEDLIASAPCDRSAAMAEVVTGLGALTYALDEYELARRLHESAVAMRRDLGSAEGLGRALWHLGFTTLDKDIAQAEAAYQEGLDNFRTLEHAPGMAGCFWGLGQVRRVQGRVHEAADYIQEGLRLARHSGNPQILGSLLRVYGEVSHELGNRRRAAELLSEALSLYALVGEWWGGTLCLENLATLAALEGQLTRATRLLGAASALRDELSWLPPVSTPEPYRSALTDLRAVLGASAFNAAWASGRACSIKQTLADGAAVAIHIREVPDKYSTSTDSGLTERERAVLRLIVAHRTDRQIGEALFISHRTVNKHVGKILAKLGVASRAEAAVHALQHDLI